MIIQQKIARKVQTSSDIRGATGIGMMPGNEPAMRGDDRLPVRMRRNAEQSPRLAASPFRCVLSDGRTPRALSPPRPEKGAEHQPSADEQFAFYGQQSPEQGKGRRHQQLPPSQSCEGTPTAGGENQRGRKRQHGKRHKKHAPLSGCALRHCRALRQWQRQARDHLAQFLPGSDMADTQFAQMATVEQGEA